MFLDEQKSRLDRKSAVSMNTDAIDNNLVYIFTTVSNQSASSSFRTNFEAYGG